MTHPPSARISAAAARSLSLRIILHFSHLHGTAATTTSTNSVRSENCAHRHFGVISETILARSLAMLTILPTHWLGRGRLMMSICFAVPLIPKLSAP